MKEMARIENEPQENDNETAELDDSVHAAERGDVSLSDLKQKGFELILQKRWTSFSASRRSSL